MIVFQRLYEKGSVIAGTIQQTLPGLVTMAFLQRRSSVPSFRNNRVLQQYVLTDVTPTGKVLGTGSYGSVLEVYLSKLFIRLYVLTI